MRFISVNYISNNIIPRDFNTFKMFTSMLCIEIVYIGFKYSRILDK